MPVPINIEKLLSGKVVESERIEFKRGWNPAAVYRSICSFANDFENIGGGYIIVGVDEEQGHAKRPVDGLPAGQLDAIQREMIGYNNLIRPFYAPKLSIETVDGKNILVIWVPGGIDRPYEVPEDVKAKDKKYHYYIRRYASSAQANKPEREELIGLTRQVPFDDCPNKQATPDDISPSLVREYLVSVESKLLNDIDRVPLKKIYQAMDLLHGPDETLYPKNIALMMFNYQPDRFFPYSRIEIVDFPKGLGDPTFYEKPVITGPLQFQIQNALEQLKNLAVKERIHKLPDRPEAQRVWSYPFVAIEEAVVNAVYHRSYEVREPIEIRILPDAIEIINYGGPDRSAKLDEIRRGIIHNRRYRNRRIGDFLKELGMTEGRGTGIPTIRKEMARNGSPEPRFETDENYSYFTTILPIHPAFLGEDASEGVNMSETQNNTLYALTHEGLSEGVNEGVNKTIVEVIDLLKIIPGLNINEIAARLEKGGSTIERYLRKLRKRGIVEFRGASKTGGYYLMIEIPDNIDDTNNNDHAKTDTAKTDIADQSDHANNKSDHAKDDFDHPENKSDTSNHKTGMVRYKSDIAKINTVNEGDTIKYKTNIAKHKTTKTDIVGQSDHANSKKGHSKNNFGHAENKADIAEQNGHVNIDFDHSKRNFDHVTIETDRIAEIIASQFEEITPNIKGKLVNLLQSIIQNEGLKIDHYAQLIGVSRKTCFRHLTILKESELIFFKGTSTKAGGYYLTEKTKDYIRNLRLMTTYIYTFRLRTAVLSDIPELNRLYQGVIMSVNRKDYTWEEAVDWASCGDNKAHWRELVTGLYFIVAENESSQIVGFASVSDEGYLHSMFVHKDFQRRGIATLLYHAIEQYVKGKGISRIMSEVSITARPFFERQGFIVDKEQRRKANKLSLANYKMSKKLKKDIF